MFTSLPLLTDNQQNLIMPRTLLLTTGTSIATGTDALRAFQQRATGWEDDASDLTEAIQTRLSGFDLATQNGRVRASAELNILARLPAKPDDEVVLFATDTADGHCCTAALKTIIQEYFGIRTVTIERVDGLQVRDAERLRTVGLVNFTRRLIHYLDDPQRRYGGGCILCPNGGFKGVLPFMTALGMIFRAPIVYVFEFADTLVTLPPLPIGIASDLLDRAMPALEWGANKGVFAPEAFYRLVSGFNSNEEEWFGSFLEITPDAGGQHLASLSPLALALAEKEAFGSGILMLSERADRDLSRLTGPDRREVGNHLRKLTSPLWRSQHRDTKHTNDLDFFPRGHNPWRFGGFVEGGIFYLCWFARHDEYDRLLPLPSSQRAAFAPAVFAEYQPQPQENPAGANMPQEDESLSWHELRIERDSARAEAESWQEDLTALRQEFRKIKDALAKARSEIADLQARIKKQGEKPASKATVEGADLKGTTIQATVIESTTTSYRLSAVDHPDAARIILPHKEAPNLLQGSQLSVEITGFDGHHFQARIPKCPPASS